MTKKWEDVVERWQSLVEEMERLGFEDYAEPEIYRAADKYINQLETDNAVLKQKMNGLSVKIADGTVWLVFPGAMISIDAIGAGRGPIVKKNLKKWMDTLLEQEKRIDEQTP